MDIFLLLGWYLLIIGCVVIWYYLDFYKFMRVYRFGQRFKNASSKKHAKIDNPLFESENFSKRAIIRAFLTVVIIYILSLKGVLSLYDFKLLFSISLEIIFIILPLALLFLSVLFVAFFLLILLCNFGDSIIQNGKGFLVRAFNEEYFFENNKFNLYIGEIITLLYARHSRSVGFYQMIYFQTTNRDNKGEKTDKIMLCLLPATIKNKNFIEQNLILQSEKIIL